MRRFHWIVSLGLSFLITGSSTAAVIWDEGVDGDLSDNRLAPTNLALSLGSNVVTATSHGGGTPDREYLHFSLGGGLQLSAIVLNAYDGADGTAFIGVQAGSTFTEPPTGTNVANLLGYSHFGPALGAGRDVGDDVEDDMGASSGAGAQGFTPPLTGPDYTFWMQQTNPSGATYTFDFQVVPEPGTLCLLGIGGLFLLRPALSRVRTKR